MSKASSDSYTLAAAQFSDHTIAVGSSFLLRTWHLPMRQNRSPVIFHASPNQLFIIVPSIQGGDVGHYQHYIIRGIKGNLLEAFQSATLNRRQLRELYAGLSGFSAVQVSGSRSTWVNHVLAEMISSQTPYLSFLFSPPSDLTRRAARPLDTHPRKQRQMKPLNESLEALGHAEPQQQQQQQQQQQVRKR